MRSYLEWQGPACGRVMVVSLVAGTMMKKEIIRGYRGSEQGEDGFNLTKEREREEKMEISDAGKDRNQ